jgi:hypothetical protein
MLTPTTCLRAGLLEQRRVAQRGRDEFAEREERGRVVVGETAAALDRGYGGHGRGGRHRREALHAEDADETGRGRLQRHAQHARNAPIAERGVRVNVGRETRILSGAQSRQERDTQVQDEIEINSVRKS